MGPISFQSLIYWGVSELPLFHSFLWSSYWIGNHDLDSWQCISDSGTRLAPICVKQVQSKQVFWKPLGYLYIIQHDCIAEIKHALKKTRQIAEKRQYEICVIFFWRVFQPETHGFISQIAWHFMKMLKKYKQPKFNFKINIYKKNPRKNYCLVNNFLAWFTKKLVKW